jgi:hypothetical protein
MASTALSDADVPSASRGRLIVEIYSPPTIRADPSQPKRARTRSDGTFRLFVVGAVLALHAGAARWFWLDTAGLPSKFSSTAPLMLLPTMIVPRSAIAHYEAPASLSSLDSSTIIKLPFAVPRLPVGPPVPTEVALPISSSADVVIGDASAADMKNITAACGVHKARHLVSEALPALTLLVRVEKDGLVSDIKVEVGSGAQNVDEAVQRCISTHALFTPRQLKGEAVPSWQRVHLSSG